MRRAIVSIAILLVALIGVPAVYATAFFVLPSANPELLAAAAVFVIGTAIFAGVAIVRLARARLQRPKILAPPVLTQPSPSQPA